MVRMNLLSGIYLSEWFRHELSLGNMVPLGIRHLYATPAADPSRMTSLGRLVSLGNSLVVFSCAHTEISCSRIMAPAERRHHVPERQFMAEPFIEIDTAE